MANGHAFEACLAYDGCNSSTRIYTSSVMMASRLCCGLSVASLLAVGDRLARRRRVPAHQNILNANGVY